jgi:hypothetical protein
VAIYGKEEVQRSCSAAEKSAGEQISHRPLALWNPGLWQISPTGRPRLLLATQDEHIVYIPDCREMLQDPLQYVKAAMLFAWADDTTAQMKIMALDTEDEIRGFFALQKDVVFVIDQTNGLKYDKTGPLEQIARRLNLHTWLIRLTANFKAVFSSSSANDSEYRNLFYKQTSYSFLEVYGGFTRASQNLCSS